MTAYRVNRRYRAVKDGERLDWSPGQIVDLAPATAEWACNDSAGVLSLVDEPQAPEVPRPAGDGPAEPTVPASDPAEEPQQGTDPVAPTADEPEPPAAARRRGGRPRKAR